MQVELYDNGQGADHVAGDGLYAKYFMQFLANQVGLLHWSKSMSNAKISHQPSKRYGLSCKVEGTNETKVNHGPNDTMREVGQSETV